MLRDTITEQVEITEATPINDGQEWSIKAMSSISQYPVGPWKKAHDGNLISKGQRVVVTMVRGRLKEGKDPDREFNYFWELSEWNTDAAPTPAPAAERLPDASKPYSTGPNDPVPLDQRIAWNSAVNNAVHTLGVQDITEDNQANDLFHHLKKVVTLADQYYRIITAGPPQEQVPEAAGIDFAKLTAERLSQMASEAPETPVAASEAGEPEARPPADKVALVVKAALHWNRDHGDDQHKGDSLVELMQKKWGVTATTQRSCVTELTEEQVDELIQYIRKGPAEIASQTQQAVTQATVDSLPF